MKVLEFNGARFAHKTKSNGVLPEGFLGFYLPRSNGYLLYKADASLEAFIVSSEKQGFFVVSAMDTDEGPRYSYGLCSLTSNWLGLTELTFSGKNEAAKAATVRDFPDATIKAAA